MKKTLSGAMLVSLLLIVASCTTTTSGFDIDSLSSTTDTAISGGTTSGSVDSSGNLLSFEVTWDDVDDDDFTDSSESVVTDSSDDEYDDYIENSTFGSTIKIAYSGTSATVSGSVSGVTVTKDGAHVTVNSTVSGVEYELSGSTTNGSFKVYSEKKFQLTLNGVTLTSTESAAINIQSSKRVFVVVTDGTTNTLTDASTYTNTVESEDQKACFFSEGQLIFSGTGELIVYGKYKHGICSDDYVRTRSGCRITVASAEKDGIHANDEIIIGGGLVKLTTEGDGLDCEEGTIDIRGGLLKVQVTGDASKAIKAETDISISGGQMILLTSGSAEYDSDDKDISSPACIKCVNLSVSSASISGKSTGAGGKGFNADGTLTITGSTVNIITTGKQYVYSSSLDSSAKGIKSDGALTISTSTVQVRTTGGDGSEGIESKSSLTINGDEVAVYAYDDCLNASSSIVINGGYVYTYSSGNDGIDSNGTLTITDGVIIASGTTSPEEGIDCDTNTFKITGGVIVGVGGGTSSPTTSACTQRSVVYGGSGTSGALFTITDSSGSHVMSYTIPRTYSTMTLLFSSPLLTSGSTFYIYSGGTVTGGSSYYGLTTGGTYTAGTKITSFTASSMVNDAGSMTSGGPGTTTTPGGGGGGWRW